MLELVQIFLRWKKFIFGFTIIATLLSIIITLPAIIPPKFESKIIFYVANPLSTDRANLFNIKDGGIVSQFGGRDDADRFIAITESAQLLETVVKKFDLIKHYRIKKATPELNLFYAKKQLLKNLNIKRNDNDAIQISCLDEDAKMAANIVNTLVEQANTINKQLIQDNKQKVLAELDKLIASKQTEVNNGNQTLNSKDLQVETLIELQNLKNQYSVSLNNNFTSIYVIEAASMAVKKAYPVRWQIVMLTAIIAFATAVLLAVVYQLYLQNAKQQNL